MIFKGEESYLLKLYERIRRGMEYARIKCSYKLNLKEGYLDVKRDL